MKAFWQAAADELAAGRRVYASFVVANRKGSPGTPAARLLLFEDGRQVGTIGGGIMEQSLLEEGKAALASGELLLPELRILRHNKMDTALASGLICGGEQTNVSFIIEGVEDQSKVDAILEALENAEEALFILNKEGFKLALDEGLNGGQYAFHEDASGDWEYRLNLVNQRRVAIFGGGHCGVALARLMDGLGYAVTIIEPRAELFTLGDLPDDVELISADFDTSAESVLHPELTIVVVMTYSMPTDVKALDGVLKFPFPKIGLMGSAQKISQIRRELAAIGHSELQIDRIHAPVGLQFDSDTPEEIAVSIAAQILLERNHEK